MVRNIGSADSMERRAANIPLTRGQSASQARYAGQARTMAPSGRAVPLPAAPAPAPAPAAIGDGSGQVQYGAETLDNPAPAPIADTSIETLRLTPEYLARERALQNQLELFGQEQATGRTRFEEDLGRSFTELGFDPTSRKFDLGELLSSGQRATIAGRAYDALRNDFAGRGMLQSGAYQARRGTLDTELMDRATALEQSRIAFGEQQQRALAERQAQAEAARTSALDEARQAVLNRFAMGA